MVRLTQAARAAVLGAMLAGAATPALAEYFNGEQMIVDFEEFAPGFNGAIHYDGEDTFIYGGVVTAGGAFSPASGANVYVGTSIETRQSADGSGGSGVDYWPGLAAYVSPGTSTVTVRFFAWSYDDNMLKEVAKFETVSGAANQVFSWFEPGTTHQSLVSMSFTADTEFAVDDLTFGDPFQMPGVPEPAIWALMILGFGAVGATLRRRRVAA